MNDRFGWAGCMQYRFVRPAKMIWPGEIPISVLFQSFHQAQFISKKRLKVFVLVFAAVMAWETLPQYFMPLLVGISVFCLAVPNSELITYLFGGASGNEGVGFFNFSLDFQYIGTSAMILPVETLVNQFLGHIIGAVLMLILYWQDVWV